MKKRIISLMLLSLFCAAGMLSGCAFHEHTLSTHLSYDENYHYYEATCGHDWVKRGFEHHEFKKWITTKTATCQQAGVRESTCSCGYTVKESLPIDPSNHVFKVLWSYDETHHYRETVCGHGDARWQEEEHRMPTIWKVVAKATCISEGREVRSCPQCGYTQERTLPSQEDAHIFSTELTGNATHHFYAAVCGHEVRKGEQEHTFSQWEITRIPAVGVSGLGMRSCFCGRTEVEIIPFGLTSIGLEYAKTKTGGYRVQGLGACTDTELKIPYVYNGKVVVKIANQAFKNTNILSVVIPKSVQEIGEGAFLGCNALTTVYYGGRKEDWQILASNIGEYNVNLTSATRYYYSDIRPQAEGNYWHYDADGNPVVWQ